MSTKIRTESLVKRPTVKPLNITAGSNDPQQNVSVKNNVVTIKGNARDNGIVVSTTFIKVGGKSYEMTPPSTADATMEALVAKLPATLDVKVLARGKDSVKFEIFKKADTLKNGGPTKAIEPMPSWIATEAKFNKALSASSPGGKRVTEGEIRDVFKAATADGSMGKVEGDLIRKKWAGLFDGESFHATTAAQRAFAELSAKFGLAPLPVR